MRRPKAGITAVWILICCVPLLAPGRAAASEAVGWLPAAEALETAGRDLDTGRRKIFLTFVSKRCSACRQMDSGTYTDTDVAAYLNRHYRPSRVDAGQHPALARRYRVRAVPTHCFLRPDGTLISCLPGAMGPADFLLILEYIQTGSYQRMSLPRFAAQAGDAR